MGSITDKPISSKSEDLLEVEKYSRALSNFIGSSDTPITIGLQGEWGTGKTSLMSLLLEDLLKKDVACSWINTWEYSIFREANQTTPQVLNGMLERLKESCEERGVWTLKNESEINFKKVASYIGNIANQVVKHHTGADLSQFSSPKANVKTRAEIAEIKELIASIIKELIEDNNNPIKKVVFFVDDLDRIPPNIAVEVLEALKNIFDIPNCVFVLAIDYEIVVKGLESKFGKKTDSNEREFRSFFDKIIQVPFNMPTGAYNIEKLLVNKLAELGVEIHDNDKELYTKTIKYTVGYNPRSLKRFLNSFSLINHLREFEDEKEGDDFLLFATLGIQITFPKVFRLLAQEPKFIKWDRKFGEKMGLEWDSLDELLKKYGSENILLDEEWERVVWGVCHMDPYIKSKVFDVLELLNLIRKKHPDDLEEMMGIAMTFATITSIDDDIEMNNSLRKIGNVVLFNDFDTWISEMRKGQEENKALGLKKREPKNISLKDEELIRNLYERINLEFKEEGELLTCIFSPTGGCSVYFNKRKAAQFGTSTKGKVELLILRDYNKNYFRPGIENLEINNIREQQISHQVPWGYTFFQILGLPEYINENIDTLIDLIGGGINTIKEGKVLTLKGNEFPKLKPIFEGTYKI